MNLKELLEKRAGIFQTMQALIDKAKAEKRELSTEETVVYDGLEKDYEALADPIARARKHEERVAEMSQSLGTVIGAQGGASGEERQAPMQNRLPLGDTESRAMAHYLRTGDPSGLAETRAYNNTDMNIGTPADGGYAVPTGLYNSIIARRDEMLLAPRLGVRNIPGKGLTVRVPIDNEDNVLFTSEAEAGSLDQDAPALYYKDFTLTKYAKYITLSWELLRDEDANLLSFVNDWIGRGVAATHNNALITEALASGTAGLTLDAAAAIGAAEIPELVGKVMPEYQEGSQWILHPTTVAYIQSLNGTQFYFAPMGPGYAGKPSLWGFPVNQSSYATAYAASAKSLIFGNFNYMGMREVQTINMLRDPYSVASAGQVRLWFWFDCVYGVLQAEAIQYATHPSA
jgi:HK97 family phage major capsid protein